ncbi:FliH/SctL family protein [Sphingomonas ginkgonis]|nr:FliH/SctL family protein [Sphingomonas ginkgonis]
MSDMTTIRLADARPIGGFRPSWRPGLQPIIVPEPVEPAADAFARGYAEGAREAEQRFAVERLRTRALLAACEAFQPEPSEGLAVLIAETVERLVRKIVGEVAVDPVTLLARAERAAAAIAAADQARTLFLHPDDVPLIDAAAFPLPILADPEIAPGSLRIETATGWVEDGTDVMLDALTEELGLKERGL